MHNGKIAVICALAFIVCLSAGGQKSYGQGPASPASSPSLAFTTQALVVSAPGVCSGPVTVETLDSSSGLVSVSTATSVALGASPADVVFFQDANCTQFPVTNVSIPAGQSSVSFYFRSWKSGSVTFNASSGALASATQVESVNPSTAPQIASPTLLQVNLGPIPFDQYDGVALNNSGIFPNCSSSWTVRQCVQFLLASYAAQGVTGARFMFGLSGGGNSTALNPSNGALNQNWVNNFNLFVQDVKSAGVSNLIPTPAFGDWGVGLSAYQQLPDACASNQNTYFYFNATLPFPQDEPNTTLTAAVSPGSAGPQSQTITVADTSGFPSSGWGTFGLPSNAGAQGFYFTVINNTTMSITPPSAHSYAAGVGVFVSGGANPHAGGNNQGYHCSPSNPIFVGWPAIERVFDSMFASMESAGVGLYEFDIENEINVSWFTVEARMIYDNTNNTDVLSDIRGLAASHGFDPGRVTYSAALSRVSVASFDCNSIYGDSARIYGQSALTQAIAGAPNGGAFGEGPTTWEFIKNGIVCDSGTSTSGLVSIPVGHTQPDIVDVHSYSCVQSASGGCDSSVSDNALIADSTVYFNDFQEFINHHGMSSAVVMIGEMWSWNGTLGGTSPEDANQPPNGVQDFISGYLQSTLAGHAVVFRPWNYLWDSSYEFPQALEPAYNTVALSGNPDANLPVPTVSNAGGSGPSAGENCDWVWISGANFPTATAGNLQVGIRDSNWNLLTTITPSSANGTSLSFVLPTQYLSAFESTGLRFTVVNSSETGSWATSNLVVCNPN